MGWYLEAFWDLAGDRPLGAMGGAGRIPFLAIDAYATRHGLADPDRFARFKSLIRALDDVYLEHAARKDKAPKRQSRK